MTRQKIDLDLIKKVKKGDSEAILKIYDYYKKKLTNFILRKFPDDRYTEDNVSEILIKVFTNIDKYSNDKAQFNTWVLSIAKNHMLDSIKKNQPIYTNFSSSSDISYDSNNLTLSCSNTFTFEGNTFQYAEPISTCSSSPDFNIITSDTLNEISNNINTCDYTMMSMKYVDGYSYAEIGNEFNLTSSEVSNKVNYSKKKLSKKIKKGE